MKLQNKLSIFLILHFLSSHCNNNFPYDNGDGQTKTEQPAHNPSKILSFQKDPSFSIPLEAKKEPKVAFADLDPDTKKDLMIVTVEPNNKIFVSSYLSTNQSSPVFQNKIQSTLNLSYQYGVIENIKQVEIMDAFYVDSEPEFHIIGQITVPSQKLGYYTVATLSKGQVSSKIGNFFTSFKEGPLNAFVFGNLCKEKKPTPAFVSSPNFLSFFQLNHYGSPYPQLSNPIAITAADFTKDGNQDLLVLNQGMQSLTLMKGSGTESCLTGIICTIQLPKEAQGQNGLEVADLNQDGNMDIIVSNHDSKNITILWGQGNDIFKEFTHINTIESPLVMKVVDLDQDGKLDIVIATSKHIKVRFADGTIQTIMSFEAEQNPSAFWIIDQNADGKLDIWLENMKYNSELDRFIGDLSLWINQSK